MCVYSKPTGAIIYQLHKTCSYRTVCALAPYLYQSVALCAKKCQRNGMLLINYVPGNYSMAYARACCVFLVVVCNTIISVLFHHYFIRISRTSQNNHNTNSNNHNNQDMSTASCLPMWTCGKMRVVKLTDGLLCAAAVSQMTHVRKTLNVGLLSVRTISRSGVS